MKSPENVLGDGTFKLGLYCAFGEGVTIILTNHKACYPNMQMQLQRDYFSNERLLVERKKKDVTIGNNTWFGHNAIVLPGVHIGDGAIIGAGSVVTKDVEPYTIVAGNPAKVIRKRFKDSMIRFLLELKWWEWGDQRIRKNREFFETDLTKISIKELKKVIVE